jgi:hypothetical protein
MDCQPAMRMYGADPRPQVFLVRVHARGFDNTAECARHYAAVLYKPFGRFVLSVDGPN